MTDADQATFNSLSTPAERAAWLLKREDFAAALDIESGKLSLCWRVTVAGVILPLTFTGSENEAIAAAKHWLKQKITGLEGTVTHAQS